jgi:hypothetical protein
VPPLVRALTAPADNRRLRGARQRFRRLALALSAAVAVSPAVAAQQPGGWLADRSATYLGVSVGAAMVSAWLQQRGKPSVPRILAAGLVGGTTIYAGQRLVGTRDRRLRLAGLQLAAVGASMTNNIARHQPPLAELTLPFFPLYLRLNAEPRLKLRVRVSALAVVSGIRLAATYGRGPHIGQWLASGAPVFAVPGDCLYCREHDGVGCVAEVTGQHVFGGVAYATDGDACLCHEFGHVAQDVRDAVLFAVPASDYALGHTGAAGRWLSKYLVVDLALPLMLVNTGLGEHAVTCSAGSLYECEVGRLTSPLRQ